MSTKAMSDKSNQAADAAWNRIANINRVLFNACVLNARNCGDVKNFEEVLQWFSVAAWSASGKGWFGELSSRELETELLRAAQQLPVPVLTRSGRSRPRWLHVLSEAYATLGHTNLCRRWIQYDPDVVHDVILVDQKSEVPNNLVETVKAANGQCVVLDPTTSLLQRAADLRKYAWENADVVLLHTHPDEVLGTVAFGVAGGPPVVVVNHADHVFWAGCGVADLVLDIRMSGHLWTKRLRGIDRAVILPIPLLERDNHERPAPAALQERRALRRSLGIPEDAIMLLTVGSAAKYEAMPDLDFVATAQQIVRACDNAYVVAIGPRDESVWKAARKATNGRILALGYQQDSTLFCRSADLYMEGFPLGSLTALLEAGEAGLPCVCAPSIPPFRSDSLSLDECPQPKDVQDYIRDVVSLAKDSRARTQISVKLQKAIRSQHCGAGWLAHLRKIKEQIPASHRIYPDFKPGGAEVRMRNWFLNFLHSKEPVPTMGTLAEYVFVEAWVRTDSRPQLDSRLWTELDQCGQYGDSRNSLAELRDTISLVRLNRRIQSRGDRNKLMSAVRDAIRNGKPHLARKLIYRCLLAGPACLVDANWIRQFAKAHLGQRLSLRLQKIFSRRGRRFNGQQPAANR
jgi:hypothetical protein